MGLTKLLNRILVAVCIPGLLDTPYIWIKYVYAQRRLPRKKSGLFNDYLYFRKRSSALLDILCQYSSDKILVKDYVTSRLGQKAVLPTFAVFGDTGEIDVAKLQKPCVIKPAHGSGDVMFLMDGAVEIDVSERASLIRSLSVSPYTISREKNYKHLRRQLICEPMLPEGEMIKDYKVFCFEGSPRVIQVDSTRHTDHRRNVYDADWTPLGIEYNFPRGVEEAAPKRLKDMLSWAESLSKDFEFVRVDFFVSGDALFVGELTHCPESAHGRFQSLADERKFSQLLFGLNE